MGVKGLLARGVPPTLPKWLLFVKIAILVLALIVLALAAYTLSLWGTDYGYGYYYGTGAPGLLIFVAIKTFLVFGAAVALELWVPKLFIRIIVLIAYILSLIFWLSAWAWAASVAASLLSYSSLYRSAYYNYDDIFKKSGGAMAAAAALGAFAWILCIVNIVFFVLACLRDPGSNNAPAPATTVYPQQQAELGQMPPKAQEAAGQQPYGGQYPAPAAYAVPQPYYGQPGQEQQPAPAGYPQPQQQQPGYGQPAPVYQQPQQPYPTQ